MPLKGKKNKNDIVVFDTSIILYDSNSIDGFEGKDVVIPLVVLDEVDKFRSLDSDTGRNARSFIRRLNSLKEGGGLLSEGIERRSSGEKVSVRFLEHASYLFNHGVLNADKNDDKILAVCLEVVASNPEVRVSLITKDISLTVKANVLGLLCEDYHADTQVKDVSELYTGTGEMLVSSDVIDTFYKTKRLDLSELEDFNLNSIRFFENMGITLVDKASPTHTALSIYKEGSLCALNYKGGKVCNVSAQNREQSFAFDLMLDDSVKLVTLTGPAGCGKTLAAVACGSYMTMDRNMYDRVVISRPIQPLGKDIGFLPGDKMEKMSPWMGPIKDSIEFIFGGDRNKMDELMHFGILEIEPLTYIRGRSLPRTLFILDESQNLNKHEMKTIISRIGKDSKIILTGDIFQIDSPFLDATTNGLTCVVEKFKEFSLAGHVSLTKGLRSDLASLAASLL